MMTSDYVMASILFWFAIGYGAGTLTFFVEDWWKSRRRRK